MTPTGLRKKGRCSSMLSTAVLCATVSLAYCGTVALQQQTPAQDRLFDSLWSAMGWGDSSSESRPHGLPDVAGFGMYPLWKFHKFDGLSLRPVPYGVDIGNGIPPAPAPPAYPSGFPGAASAPSPAVIPPPNRQPSYGPPPASPPSNYEPTPASSSSYNSHAPTSNHGSGNSGYGWNQQPAAPAPNYGQQPAATYATPSVNIVYNPPQQFDSTGSYNPPAAPAGGYGEPAPSYGNPPQSYNSPNGQNGGYVEPTPSYGGPPPSNNSPPVLEAPAYSPPQMYNAPANPVGGYGEPAVYGSPPMGYNGPSAPGGYGDSQSYGGSPPVYNAPPVAAGGYGDSQSYGGSPPVYNAPAVYNGGYGDTQNYGGPSLNYGGNMNPTQGGYEGPVAYNGNSISIHFPTDSQDYGYQQQNNYLSAGSYQLPAYAALDSAAAASEGKMVQTDVGYGGGGFLKRSSTIEPSDKGGDAPLNQGSEQFTKSS